MESKYTKSFIIDESHLAKVVGSGGLAVSSTPSMIAFMENTAWEALENELVEEKTTVGTKMNVQHLKPSAAGKTVDITAEVTRKSDYKVSFSIEALVEGELIGKAEHKRAIVNSKEFMESVSE